MAPITEEQENNLDEGKVITLKLQSGDYQINKENVIVYGSIDFTNDSQDMEQIERFDWLNKVNQSRVVPANYDYESHTAKSDLDVARVYDTSSCKTVVKFGHGVINKPERCIIFKYRINKYDSKRTNKLSDTSIGL